MSLFKIKLWYDLCVILWQCQLLCMKQMLKAPPHFNLFRIKYTNFVPKLHRVELHSHRPSFYQDSAQVASTHYSY